MARQFYYPALGTPSLATTAVLTRTIGLDLAADALLKELSEFVRHGVD